MLQRAGVHGDERRMDDGPGIHERARERVAASLDHAGESLRDDGQRVVLAGERKHAGGQALGTHGDRNLERPMLARQPRQRPGFRKDHVGSIAGITCSLGEQHRAERCRRQEHDLPVHEMRREHLGDIRLRGRGRRAQDQLRPAHGLGHVGGDARQHHLMASLEILHQDSETRIAMRGNRLRVAPPQPHLVPDHGQIAGRRERPVSSP
jgi:hypothetical protein